LDLTYTLFKSNRTLASAGASFPVTSGTLKFQVDLDAWNFTTDTSTLVMSVNVNVSPAVTSMNTTTDNTSTTYTLTSGTFSVTIVRILFFALVDNVPTAINFSFAQVNESAYNLTLHFPFFKHSLHYDPDFSTVLQGSSSTSSGDGGSTNLLPLLSLIALVIPIAFILLAVVICVVIAVKKWRWRRLTGESGSGVSL